MTGNNSIVSISYRNYYEIEVTGENIYFLTNKNRIEFNKRRKR